MYLCMHFGVYRECICDNTEAGAREEKKSQDLLIDWRDLEGESVFSLTFLLGLSL